MVIFDAIVPSECNSPLCPASIRIDRIRFRQIVLRNPRQLTQVELEICLTPIDAVCDEAITDEVVQQHGEDMFQLLSSLNIETEQEEDKFVCGRNRVATRLQIQTSPKLMVLNALEYWNVTKNVTFHSPARLLLLDEMEYLLEQ
jgi:hypothetical protein